jgi:hypothetical protein
MGRNIDGDRFVFYSRPLVSVLYTGLFHFDGRVG